MTYISIFDQVFLESLTSVVGQTKSRELLPKCTSSVEEKNRLQLLGLVLGIDQWSGAFNDRVKPPSYPLHSSPLKVKAEEEAYIYIDVSANCIQVLKPPETKGDGPYIPMSIYQDLDDFIRCAFGIVQIGKIIQFRFLVERMIYCRYLLVTEL